MSKALVTVLMPVKSYHRRYLHEAVGSLIAQTRPDWRLLVVVEPSGRAAIERELAEELADSRVAIAVNAGRRLAGALNTGMRLAATEWVAILLGDDLWAPQAVEVLARAIASSPGTDFFHSARRVVDGEGRAISSVHRSRRTVSVDEFRRGTSPAKHLLCWRRKVGLAAGGLDESLGSVGVDDFDFPWTMAEHGATFTAIPDCLYLYRDHRDAFRLTTHLPLSHHKREMARVMRKHGVGEGTIAGVVAAAEQSYLKQCLFRSPLDRSLKRLRRYDPGRGWRESYR